jgi:hypothetical protein
VEIWSDEALRKRIHGPSRSDYEDLIHDALKSPAAFAVADELELYGSGAWTRRRLAEHIARVVIADVYPVYDVREVDQALVSVLREALSEKKAANRSTQQATEPRPTTTTTPKSRRKRGKAGEG